MVQSSFSASSKLLPSLSENGLIWLNLINLWSTEIAIYIFFPSKIMSNKTKVLPWLALGKVAMSSTLGVDDPHQSQEPPARSRASQIEALGEGIIASSGLRAQTPELQELPG